MRCRPRRQWLVLNALGFPCTYQLRSTVAARRRRGGHLCSSSSLDGSLLRLLLRGCFLLRRRGCTGCAPDSEGEDNEGEKDFVDTGLWFHTGSLAISERKACMQATSKLSSESKVPLFT